MAADDSSLGARECWLRPAPEADPHPSIPYCVSSGASKTSSGHGSALKLPLTPKGQQQVTFDVVCNPAAGGRKAEVWLDRVVLPMLESCGHRVRKHVSASPEDLVSIGKSIVHARTDDGPLRLVLMGGDGTTSELLNALVSSEGVLPPVHLALIPLGTANALYFSCRPDADLEKPEQTIDALVKACSQPDQPGSGRLSLVSVKVLDQSGRETTQKLAHVVVSTSLHAAILRTADELRSEIEGLERFKVAFAKNATRTWRAKVTFDDATVYDPSSQTFNPFEPGSIEGEFNYFAGALVDRFEQKFVIAPLRRDAPADSIDVVVVRPPKDVGSVLMQAYNDGAHLPEVEYFRCSGWNWVRHPSRRFE